jgi:hypothetical protein
VGCLGRCAVAVRWLFGFQAALDAMTGQQKILPVEAGFFL